LVRTCYRENIRDIKEAQLILNNLVQKYNYRIVHSTTGEIPYIRFQRAIREKRSLFREFTIRPPFKSSKDIFCLRVDRMVNSYRKVSINNLELKVPSAPLHENWSEPLRLDTLSLNTPCIPESHSLLITSRIPPEADNPKRNATSSYYTHLQ